MFSFNIGGVPALKMIPLADIDSNKFYLSSDQQLVIMFNATVSDSYIVYNLDKGYVEVFGDDSAEVISEYPALAMVYPDHMVSISLNLAINGGTK